MWPFNELRRGKRWAVEWEASLLCKFEESDDTVRVTVTEVSLKGVRLHLDSMQVGAHHLMVGDAPLECELTIPVPQGLVKSSIEFRWFNQEHDGGRFSAGVEFVDMTAESIGTLRLALKSS